MRDSKVLSTGLLKSTLRRFWPLWLFYSIALALLLVAPAYTVVTSIARESYPLQDKLEVVERVWVLARIQALVITLVAAIVVATALNDQLFSDTAATFVGSLVSCVNRLPVSMKKGAPGG